MNKTRINDIKRVFEGRLKNMQNQDYRDWAKKCALINGKQYILDGITAFALNTPVELSKAFTFDNNDKREKENAEILVEMYHKFVNPEGTNELKRTPPTVSIPAAINATIPLKVPTKKEVQAFIKEDKERGKGVFGYRKKPWDFGDGLPAVNPRFLLDVLKVFGDGVEMFAGAKWCDGIYIKGDIGDGVLYPVVKENDMYDYRTKTA